MKPNMRWLDKGKSTLQPDEPKIQIGLVPSSVDDPGEPLL
jgi:hypothetical protein